MRHSYFKIFVILIIFTVYGHSENAFLVKDIRVGSASSNPWLLSTIDSLLYFYADDGNGGGGLWRSDGTISGTVRDYDINSMIYERRMLNFNGIYFFINYDYEHGAELWTSDDLESSGTLLKDINPGPNDSNAGNLFILNDLLFFTANDGIHGTELWKSDGTEVGTVLVQDIRGGDSDSSIKYFTALNNILYFSAQNWSDGEELWRTDGTEAGTFMVKNIYPTHSSRPRNIVTMNNKLFFTADNNGSNGLIWVSDGTSQGTTQLQGNDGNLYGLYLTGNLTIANNTLFYTGRNNSTNHHLLLKSDGTAAGTVFVKRWGYSSINNNSPIRNLTEVNGELFFTLDLISSGEELWISDGTEIGTLLVKDIWAGSNGSDPSNLIVANDLLYFQANAGSSGTLSRVEPWRSDGTEDGTYIVRDIAFGASSFPHSFTFLNNTLFFVANDQIHGDELWKTEVPLQHSDFMNTELGDFVDFGSNIGVDLDLSNTAVSDGLLNANIYNHGPELIGGLPINGNILPYKIEILGSADFGFSGGYAKIIIDPLEFPLEVSIGDEYVVYAYNRPVFGMADFGESGSVVRFDGTNYWFYADNLGEFAFVENQTEYSLDWSLHIQAKTEMYSDFDNYIGVAQYATDGFDVNYDILEPPPPPNEFISLYFPHTEWDYPLGDNFSQDIQSSTSLDDTTKTWLFSVITTQDDSIKLKFETSYGFPEQATIILHNLVTNESFSILGTDSLSFFPTAWDTSWFSISIGDNPVQEPTNVSINNPSQTSFSSLSWTDNSVIEEGYIVYHSINGITFNIIDTLAENSVEYFGTILSDLEVNTEYWFKISAFNSVVESDGVITSLFTLSKIPSAPIIIDSTLTTIDLFIAENENPSPTEFAIGVTGGIYGQITHYIQSNGSILGDTSQVWATKDFWGALTIMGLAPETEYSIKVKSRNGNLVESQFGTPRSITTGNNPTVTLLNPLGPAILRSNSPYSVDWLMSNTSFVDSVFLYYSSDSGATFDLLSSLSNVDSYSWTTPSEHLTYGGKIKVEIKDEAGRYSYDESAAPFVIVGDSLSFPIQFGWTLWGVPLVPYIDSIRDNFEDDFEGGWWSFRYSNGGYLFNNSLSIEEGYWLATDASAILDIKGQPVTTAYSIDLAQGWELLTNPLVTDVDRDSLLITKDNSTIPFSEAVSNGWVSSEFYHYSTSLGGYEMPDVLEPWKGYWFGVVDSGVSVTFPIHSTNDQLVRSTRDILTDADWRVHLEIQAGSAHDWALIGVDSNATDNFDVGFDVPKPPTTPNPNHVNIGFNHPDWNPVLGESYIIDIRSPLADPAVKEWEVQLSSTIEDSLITVSWTIDNIPEDMVYSFEYGTESINLLEQGSLDFPYSGEVISFFLKAEKSPVSAEDAKVIPTEYSLQQNFPNPFNPITTIRYGLPEAAQVTLFIYDIKGRKVRSLIGEQQAAGSYEYQWNGMDDSGQPVSTGLYLTRLQAGSYTKTIKMLYLK